MHHMYVSLAACGNRESGLKSAPESRQCLLQFSLTATIVLFCSQDTDLASLLSLERFVFHTAIATAPPLTIQTTCVRQS